MTRSKVAVLIILLSTGLAGCKPAKKISLHGRPTIWLEPRELCLANSCSTDVRFEVVFSNSTDHLLVMARDDIDLQENFALVSEEILRLSKDKDDVLNLKRGTINPGGKSWDPDVVKLNPGDTLSRVFKVEDIALSSPSGNQQIFAVFYGWPNVFIGYDIKAFPKDLRPFVWSYTVTSQPMRVVWDTAVSGSK